MNKNSYALDLQKLAQRIDLPFYEVQRPEQIQAHAYLMWIVPPKHMDFRIWLNRVDFGFSQNTRIAWFPESKPHNNLPHSIDFALWDSSVFPFEQLLTARQKAFSPFFDHIPNLAFKNALGLWTVNSA